MTAGAASMRARVTPGRLFAAIVVLGLAWLFADFLGLLIAVIGLVACEVVGPRWIAASAAGALAIAAIATLLESDAVNIAFTAARPVAADAGKVAAVLALTAMSSFVARERAGARTHQGPDA